MKRIVKQTAKKVQEESLETLKTVKKQVAGSDLPLPEPPASPEISPEGGAKIKQRDLERVRALEKEMEDIRKQKKQKEEEEEKQEVLEEPVPDIPGKPSRRIAAGMKGKLSKLKRKAEIRMPPSG